MTSVTVRRKLTVAPVTLLYWTKDNISEGEISLSELVKDVYGLTVTPEYVASDEYESLMEIKPYPFEQVVIDYLIQKLQVCMRSQNTWLLLTDLCTKGLIEPGFYVLKEKPTPGQT